MVSACYSEIEPFPAQWLRNLVDAGHIASGDVVEPGTFPLAHGLPGRVGRLRAYGNAIVPQLAAEFVRAAMEVQNAR